jgi:excisionase family DNA binding protein
MQFLRFLCLTRSSVIYVESIRDNFGLILKRIFFMTKRTESEPANPLASSGLVKKKEIARFLGISPRTVDECVAQRKIPFIRLNSRLNLFRIADVERALNKLTVLEGSAK